MGTTASFPVTSSSGTGDFTESTMLPTASTAANYKPYCVIPVACEIISIRQLHQTAGTNGSPVTMYVEKLTGTQIKGAGVTTMNGTFDLKGVADTVQVATLTDTAADKTLAAGDRLSLVTSGTLTSVVGVVVTVLLRPI